MNVLDIILIGLLVIGGVRGFRKGIILEIAGLFGLLLAVFGAFQFIDWGVSFIARFAEINAGLVTIISFVGIFLAIFFAVYIIGWLAKATVHITPFGIFDSIIGMLVGIFKWSFLISLLFYIGLLFEINLDHEQFHNSAAMPYVIALAPYFLDLIGIVIPYFEGLITSIESLFNGGEH